MSETNDVLFDYKSPKPISDAEITDIFPEAREIIPELLSELAQRRNTILEAIKARAKAINAESSDETYRYFWKKWLRLTLGADLQQIDKNMARLERMIRAINGLQPANGLTDDLIRIAKATPVESVINQQFRKTGSTLVGLCPFHQERTPSFHIFKSNRGHCFGGCGKGGDVIDIYMLLQGCSFKEAVFALAGGRS